jgi:hypothetical protein
MIQSTAIALLLLAASVSFANEGHDPTKGHEQKLGPAPIYNGNTPIDRSHGLLFNNGTFGLPNDSIEEWARTPVLFPGISEKNYAYESCDQREKLIREAGFQVEWGHAALRNYETVSADSRPEAIEHSKKAIQTLEPSLTRLETALDKLKDAGAKDWESAQGDLRRAITDFRLAYTQMHKNVHM